MKEGEGAGRRGAVSKSTTVAYDGGTLQGLPDLDRKEWQSSIKSVASQQKPAASRHREDFELVSFPSSFTASHDMLHEPFPSFPDVVLLPPQPFPTLLRVTPSPPSLSPLRKKR